MPGFRDFFARLRGQPTTGSSPGAMDAHELQQVVSAAPTFQSNAETLVAQQDANPRPLEGRQREFPWYLRSYTGWRGFVQHAVGAVILIVLVGVLWVFVFQFPLPWQ